MNAEHQTYAALIAAPALTALVGTRISPDKITQGENSLPAIIYDRIDSEAQQGLGGSIEASNVMMQISCWAKDRATATAVANAASDAMTAEPNFFEQKSRAAQYLPEIEEYADVMTFSVWEL